METQMKSKARRKAPVPRMPRDLKAVFGEPFLLPFEKAKSYEDLRNLIAAELHPNDTIEWMIVMELVDALWEQRRLKKYQIALFANARRAASHRLLVDMKAPNTQYGDRERVSNGLASEVRKTGGAILPSVQRELASYEYHEDTVDAEAWQLCEQKNRHIDDLIYSTIARRQRAIANLIEWREQRERLNSPRQQSIGQASSKPKLRVA
jgi:hypothetical protein